MTGGWDFGGESAAAGDGVTLIEGSSFCVCAEDGSILSGSAHGVFHMDTRVLSTWQVTLDGAEIEPLAAFVREPHHATFLGRARPRTATAESTLLVQRERYVGAGLREDVQVQNLGAEPAAITLTIHVDADFADLFAVKEGRQRPPAGERSMRTAAGLLEIDSTSGLDGRGVRVRAPGALTAPGVLAFQTVIPAKGEWRTSVQVLAVVGGSEVPPRFPVEEPIDDAAPSVRVREWVQSAPLTWVGDADLLNTLYRSGVDLGSLRITDPDAPDRFAVAAGAPWFMALFGRDSLLTALMALPLDPALAFGTLHTLARHQGRREDAVTEEQPGRILHEMRFGPEASLALGGGNAYYGTADATPLFVVLLGELWRWGLGDEELHTLLPHADRALEWVRTHGDRDGDGFVEYQRLTDRGLRNQGWKDSWDGINFAAGDIAEPPIALCEVQGYVYAAYRTRAAIAAYAGDGDAARTWSARADDLKRSFNERFWLPDHGWYAVGLDRDKRPIDSLTSNIGHCLWSGIVDEDKAAQVAQHLLSPAMFSGWGVRTLASSMAAYNPISYHNGSVWPHDNAIVAAGLMRYGFVEEAGRVARAVLDAARAFGGRLPELFTGLDRSEYPAPVDYPASCSPQAWASAAPLHLIRTLLRFEPDLPAQRLHVAPALPDTIPELRVDNLPLGSSRVSLVADRQSAKVTGVPPGVEVAHEPHWPT